MRQSASGLGTLSIAALGFVISCITPSNATDLLGLIGGETIATAQDKLKQNVDDTLGTFLSMADQKATQLLNRGTDAGSLLTIQAANQMAVLSETVRNQFGDELGKKLNSVSVQTASMLVELQRWRDSVDSLNDKAVSLLDLVALDLEDVIPFSDKLAVRRIRGGVFIENDPSTFVVDLTGPHFGGDPSGVTTTFDVSLNDVKLDTPSPKPPIDAIFNIKADMLQGLFDRNKIIVLPLKIHIKRSQPRLGGILGSSNEEITLPYKVSLLPKYAGTVAVTSKYPEYEWQAKGAVRPITATIRDDQALAGFAFRSTVPNPALQNPPQPGSDRIDRESLQVNCKPDIEPARQFANGKIYPLVCIRTGSPNWSVFDKGYVSPRYVGGGGDQRGSHDDINNDFFARFGFRLGRRPVPPFTPGSGSPPYLEDRCAENEHCVLSPAELAAQSQPATVDVSSCPIMEWKPNENNFQQQDTQITVYIRKKIGATIDDLCQRAGNATWEMSYNILQYGPKAELTTKVNKYPVYIGEPVVIPIMKSEGSGTVYSTISFSPIVGRTDTSILPADVSNNFRSAQPSDMTDRIIYTYTFQYPRLNIAQ